MLPLAGMLFNVVSGLVVDKAQNLAKDHVGKMLDDLLPDDAKEELDKLIADDPNHPHQSAEEALQQHRKVNYQFHERDNFFQLKLI